MMFHEFLNRLGQKLGYPRTEGYCLGFTIRWLEACFLDEEGNFEHRNNFIFYYHSDIPRLIKQARLKNKNRLLLNQLETDAFDVEVFFDSMVLYNSPSVFSELYNKTLLQINVEKSFADSLGIRRRGGLIALYFHLSAYSHQSFKDYLYALHWVINWYSEEPLGLLLLGRAHATGLFYKPKTAEPWRFMNINPFPHITLSNPEISNEMLTKIAEGFHQKELLIFSTLILMPADFQQNRVLQQALFAIRPQQLLTLSNKADIEDYLSLAVQDGDLNLLNALLRQYPQRIVFIQKLLDIASFEGHLDLIKALVTCYGADVNRSSFQVDTSSLFMAAKYGKKEAVDLLLSLGANPFIFYPHSIRQLRAMASYFLPNVVRRTNEFILSHPLDNKGKLYVLPIDIAKIHGHTIIVSRLRAQMMAITLHNRKLENAIAKRALTENYQQFNIFSANKKIKTHIEGQILNCDSQFKI